MYKIITLTILFVSTPSTLCISQETPKPKKAIKLKFDDELVEGRIDTPELLYLNSKLPDDKKKLIKFRQHFMDEMDGGREDFGTNE